MIIHSNPPIRPVSRLALSPNRESLSSGDGNDAFPSDGDNPIHHFTGLFLGFALLFGLGSFKLGRPIGLCDIFPPGQANRTDSLYANTTTSPTNIPAINPADMMHVFPYPGGVELLLPPPALPIPPKD